MEIRCKEESLCVEFVHLYESGEKNLWNENFQNVGTYIA